MFIVQSNGISDSNWKLKSIVIDLTYRRRLRGLRCRRLGDALGAIASVATFLSSIRYFLGKTGRDNFVPRLISIFFNWATLGSTLGAGGGDSGVGVGDNSFFARTPQLI